MTLGQLLPGKNGMKPNIKRLMAYVRMETTFIGLQLLCNSQTKLPKRNQWPGSSLRDVLIWSA